jgi:hypothetical protein
MKLRSRHYWRRYLLRADSGRFAANVCDPRATIAMLSRQPEPTLSWFDRALAWLTTFFKRLGIAGWKETGCEASARGRPVREAQHSTDGFWTIDVALEAFAFGTTTADLTSPRYLRLEVEPGTAAHAVCAATRIGSANLLAFSGAVVIDPDGPFLEVHPEEDFRILA